MPWRTLHRAFVVLASAIAIAWSASAEARVARVVIDQVETPAFGGQSFGDVGQYERLRGRVFGELDPHDRRNAIIQDIEFAPRNARGNVEYVATFTMLKPIDPAKGNRVLLYEVVNRGNKQLAGFNVGGDPGDGFFYKRGYTILWSGWQGDVIPTATNETIQVPVAKQPDGSSITGPVLIRISNAPPFRVVPPGTNTQQLIVFNAPTAYRPVTLDTTRATLTSRASETVAGKSGPITTIPSVEWAWADCRTVPFPGTPDPTRICLKNGFDPNLLYELRFTAKDPLVLGVGVAATRDIVSFFRHQAQDDVGTPNPAANALSHVIGQGTSQSGNFMKTFIHLGFNEDEQGRIVFEGANPHIAARQNPINFRFAHPGGAATLYEPGSEPVLWWRKWPDRVRDRPAAGMLDRCRATHTCPKIFETFTAAEFWDLRMSPGLVGTDAEHDIPLRSNVRRYYFPGTTHGGGGGGFSIAQPSLGFCELPNNPNPARETMRALFDALKDWVVEGRSPPESDYPLVRRRQLVTATKLDSGFPAIPGVPLPGGLLNPVLDYDFGAELNYNDLTGVITRQPPRIKQIVPTLVPRVDRDGNEIDGVRSVLHQAALGSYFGWNILAAGFTKGQICAFIGGSAPFAKSKSERSAAGDPRPSVEERYGSQEGYDCVVTRAAQREIRRGFLLQEDADRLIAEAAGSNVLPSDPGNPIAKRLCKPDRHDDDRGHGHHDGQGD
jgi:hypothetical protein